MRAEDFENLVGIARRNPSLRDDLGDVVVRHAADYVYKKNTFEAGRQRRGPFVREAQEWRDDVDIEEGKMHRLLGVDEDTEIMKAYDDPSQLAEDLVAEVGQQSAVGMLSVPLASGGDVEDFYRDAIDHIEEEIPNE